MRAFIVKSGSSAGDPRIVLAESRNQVRQYVRELNREHREWLKEWEEITRNGNFVGPESHKAYSQAAEAFKKEHGKYPWTLIEDSKFREFEYELVVLGEENKP